MDVNPDDLPPDGMPTPNWKDLFNEIKEILSTRLQKLDIAIAATLKIVEETGESSTFATLQALDCTMRAYRARFLASGKVHDFYEALALGGRCNSVHAKTFQRIDSSSDTAEKEKIMESGSGHEALEKVVREFFADLPASSLQKVVLSSMDYWLEVFQTLQKPDCTIDVEEASAALIDLSKALLLQFHSTKEASILDALLACFLDASDFFPVGLPGMSNRRMQLFTHFLLLDETRCSVVSEPKDVRYVHYYQYPQNRPQSSVVPMGIMLQASRAHLGRYEDTKERHDLDFTVRLLAYLLNHPRLDSTSDLWDSMQEQVVQLAESYYKTLPDLTILTDKEKYALLHSQNIAYETLLHWSFVALVSRYHTTSGEYQLGSGQAEAVMGKMVQRLSLPPPDHPALLSMMDHFATTFVEQFMSKPDQTTIQSALQTLQQVAPPSLPTYPWLSLVKAFRNQHEKDQEVSHLNEASTILSACSEHFSQKDSSKIDILHRWATLKLDLFEVAGNPEDLEVCVKLYEECIRTGDELGIQQPAVLSKLAIALVWKYKLSGGESLLTEAVDLCRKAKSILSFKDEEKRTVFGNLCHCLRTRFYSSKGDPMDLKEAEELATEMASFEANSGNDPLSPIITRGSILWSHFDSQGTEAYLDEALTMFQQATPLVDGRLDWVAQQYSNLYAVCLMSRFEREGRPEDLETATKLHERTLALRRNRHTLRAETLTNLAYCRLNQFQETGNRQLLDESIEMYREAIDCRPFPHYERPSSLTNLARALQVRCRFTNRTEDVLESLRLARQAVEMYTGQHPWRLPALNNLVGPLLLSFQAEQKPTYLKEAIEIATEVLEGRSQLDSHPVRLASLHNLASLLLLQCPFLQKQDHNLQRAISMQTEVVDSVPPNHPLRSQFHENLATMLLARFEQSKERSDILKAIKSTEQALELEPSPHLRRFLLLEQRANLLQTQYSECEPSNQGLLQEVMDAFKEAVSYTFSSPSQRLTACQRWVFSAESTGHPSILLAHRTRLLLLHELVNLTPGSRERQELLLSGTDGMARAAALCFIEAGKLEEAIELLELGRAVFWTQMLKLRTPLDLLQLADPSLARKWKEVSSALELAFHRNASPLILNADDKTKLQQQQEIATVNRMTDSLDKVLAEIRKLKGFEQFLKPRSFESIRRAVKRWPVVFLIPGESYSYALVLTSTDLHKVTLHKASQTRIKTLLQKMQEATGAFDGRLDDPEREVVDAPETRELESRLENSDTTERGIRPALRVLGKNPLQTILRTLWADVAQPIIEVLGYKKSETPPILRWCPVGIFGFLPLHAAGVYDGASREIDCVSEYVTSSYVPAIEVLVQDGEEDSKYGASLEESMLAVVEKSLPATITEIEAVEKIVEKQDIRFIKLGTSATCQATVARVVESLPKARIAHFACHGKQDAGSPLDSYLKLEDGRLLLSTILRECHIQGSDLAFLCACETATGDKRAPDEAMSLGSCLVYSGFRNVVATMWEIKDSDGPIVASAFYAELFGEGKENIHSPTSSTHAQSVSSRNFHWTFDEEASARALHSAMRTLRQHPGISFSRWLPFVHISGRR